MVRYKIDGSVGGLWVRLFAALERLVKGQDRNAPSPLKGFTATPTKGNAT